MYKRQVIHVRHRLSYRIVREILVNGDEELAQKYEDVVPMLKMMEELCLVLRKKRTTRGAIDFDLPEQKVILDEQGRPVEIVQRIRSIAESIIEEFMLDIMYEIPKDENIGEVTITRSYIEGTGGPLISLRGQEVPRLP